jgi:dTMP kinase
MSGRFIVFEGPEGAGKTTQIQRLADALREGGVEIVTTREPGGTAIGERIRALLLDRDVNLSPVAEALLMNGARDAHVREVIEPSLAAGKTVLCDRFSMSTRAYQGGGGGVDDGWLAALEEHVCRRRPDLTILLDLDPGLGMARANARGTADRFEAKGAAYHERVATAFRSACAGDANCVSVDANGDVDKVHRFVVQTVRQRLPQLIDGGHGSS